MGRIAVQGLPKSHVGPKGYRLINISVITYEPHCVTYVAQQKLTEVEVQDRETFQIFLYSNNLDLMMFVIHWFFPPDIHIPSLWQVVIFSLIVARCTNPQLDGCTQCLTDSKVLSPSGPSTAPQVQGINLENCEVTEQTKIYVPTLMDEQPYYLSTLGLYT